MMNNFLKNIIKYGKKVEKLMRIDFESQPTYGYDNKYIKIKIFIIKKYQKKK